LESLTLYAVQGIQASNLVSRSWPSRGDGACSLRKGMTDGRDPTLRQQLTKTWDGEPERQGETVGERGLKQRLIHEVWEFLRIFLYLAPFFCAFATYRMLLLDQFKEKYFAYGAAFVNALVLSKIILLGEYLRLGKRQEHKPLIYSTIYKSFAFTLLVVVFHILENTVKGVIHGEGIVGSFAALSGRGIGEMLGHSLVMFCAFLPFFALREIERALGEGRLTDLFLRSRASAESDPIRKPIQISH
jgi:hypothetical protein